MDNNNNGDTEITLNGETKLTLRAFSSWPHIEIGWLNVLIQIKIKALLMDHLKGHLEIEHKSLKHYKMRFLFFIKNYCIETNILEIPNFMVLLYQISS